MESEFFDRALQAINQLCMKAVNRAFVLQNIIINTNSL
jgi:hypothetical protein